MSYQILVKAYAVVVVHGAETADEALDVAGKELNLGDCEFETGSVEKKLERQDYADAERHAGKVVIIGK